MRLYFSQQEVAAQFWYADFDKNGIQDCADDTQFTNQTKYKYAYAWCKALDIGYAAVGVRFVLDSACTRRRSKRVTNMQGTEPRPALL
jgi:hypothetical protein